MRNCVTMVMLCLLTTLLSAQMPDKVFEWQKASTEDVQLDLSEYHAGRVYRPASGGGDMHIIIDAKLPVTVMMAFARDWNEAINHPESLVNVEYRCIREHVLNTVYECHMPDGRPMVLVLRDKRLPLHPRVQGVAVPGIGVIFNKGGLKNLVAPNTVQITYHRWACIENCIQPEFRWSLLVKEKYQLTSSPKLYSVLTPERDDQEVWMKIKSGAPITIALLPSRLADQVYDHRETVSSALAQTTCKQRGIEKMEFSCKVNLADGPQSLIVLPDSPLKSGKKAEIEFQSFNCVANCNLLNATTDTK